MSRTEKFREQHKDPAILAKAKTSIDQMGGIKEAFSSYMAEYPTAQAIESAPAGFVSDTGDYQQTCNEESS